MLAILQRRLRVVMSGRDDIEWFRHYRNSADHTPAKPTEAGCLDERIIAGLVDGTLDDHARLAAVTHVATCGHCRLVVASVARAVAHPAIARSAEDAADAAPAGRRLVPRRHTFPLVAVAVLVLAILGPPALRKMPSTHRARSAVEATSPLGLSPTGAVTAVDVFRWAGVVGADRYRVTLYDASGHVLFERELGDTLAALPDSVRLGAGERYLWRVDARSSFDRWSSSAMVEFRVGASRRP